MGATYLDLYRRHLNSCPHKAAGQGFSLCQCPIWAYGKINGVLYRRTTQTNDAARAHARVAWLLGNPEDLAPESRPIHEAVTLYLSECAKRNLRPKSIASYARTLKLFADFAGERKVKDLNTELVAAFRDSRKVAPRTQRKELEFIRALCTFCVDRQWLSDNPARRVKPPKVEDGATLPFTAEEIAKLLPACDRMEGMNPADTPLVRQRARAIVLLLMYSGLRIGDAAQLRRSRLLASGHLVLRTEKNNVPVKVKLHPRAISALTALPAPGGNAVYYFWSGHGDPDDCSKSLWRTLHRLGKVAGVHVHPHRFRDTFCVELLSKGCDIRTIQKLLGHTSIRTTEKHYAHFVVAHQRILDAATDLLDF